MRRFLLHVLPSGFMKIRHYGFLGNPAKKEALTLCRKLIAAPAAPKTPSAKPKTWRELLIFLTGKDPTLCPSCGQGRMLLCEDLPRQSGPPLKKTG